ncbi:MAG: restriction endonuclease [Hyphomonas sp.]
MDGVIDQDPLGVEQIYTQAKRYAEGNTVGAGGIRDFFGGLSLKRASKCSGSLLCLSFFPRRAAPRTGPLSVSEPLE